MFYLLLQVDVTSDLLDLCCLPSDSSGAQFPHPDTTSAIPVRNRETNAPIRGSSPPSQSSLINILILAVIVVELLLTWWRPSLVDLQNGLSPCVFKLLLPLGCSPARGGRFLKDPPPSQSQQPICCSVQKFCWNRSCLFRSTTLDSSLSSSSALPPPSPPPCPPLPSLSLPPPLLHSPNPPSSSSLLFSAPSSSYSSLSSSSFILLSLSIRFILFLLLPFFLFLLLFLSFPQKC